MESSLAERDNSKISHQRSSRSLSQEVENYVSPAVGFTIVAIRNAVPVLVNHNISREEITGVMAELRVKQESFVIFNPKSPHVLGENFICQSCREIIHSKFEVNQWP